MTTKIPGYKPEAIELYRCQAVDEFPAILHFLSAVGFNGKAEVVALDVLGRGHLFFENGKVVHATEGATVGIDAVARMLIWERSEVHLFRRVVAPVREFSCNTNNLIMDATLLADQNAALWRSQSRKLENVPEPNSGERAADTLSGWKGNGRSIGIAALGVVVLLLLFSHGCRSLVSGTAGADLSAASPSSAKFLNRLKKGKSHVIKGLQLSMRPLPGGRYERLYSSGEGLGEQTAVVSVPAFWMSSCEVTQADFMALMGRNPSHFRGPDLPVEGVTWHDAQFFCERLTGVERATGALPAEWEYRLPTELEWEYALGAGDATFDPDTVVEIAWIRDNAGKRTQRVAAKAANHWGLHDMLGNVNEWCLDWMGRQPSPGAAVEKGGDLRACRGGSWLQAAEFATPLKRVGMQWESANNIIGFRPILARVGEFPTLDWK